MEVRSIILFTLVCIENYSISSTLRLFCFHSVSSPLRSSLREDQVNRVKILLQVIEYFSYKSCKRIFVCVTLTKNLVHVHWVVLCVSILYTCESLLITNPWIASGSLEGFADNVNVVDQRALGVLANVNYVDKVRGKLIAQKITMYYQITLYLDTWCRTKPIVKKSLYPWKILSFVFFFCLHSCCPHGAISPWLRTRVANCIRKEGTALA